MRATNKEVVSVEKLSDLYVQPGDEVMFTHATRLGSEVVSENVLVKHTVEVTQTIESKFTRFDDKTFRLEIEGHRNI
ncbi:MAG: hypothetical protein NVSMB31_01460 [Vulcanimicrobiaceae bacterium]